VNTMEGIMRMLREKMGRTAIMNRGPDARDRENIERSLQDLV
jgi:hypothetical protein